MTNVCVGHNLFLKTIEFFFLKHVLNINCFLQGGYTELTEGIR